MPDRRATKSAGTFDPDRRSATSKRLEVARPKFAFDPEDRAVLFHHYNKRSNERD